MRTEKTTMKCRIVLAAAALLLGAAPALADPIDGQWRTSYGQTAAIAGGVITLKTGKYAGKRIGRLKPTGDGTYAGTITDPSSDRSYSGTAELIGSSLRMTGCILKMVCRSRTWERL